MLKDSHTLHRARKATRMRAYSCGACERAISLSSSALSFRAPQVRSAVEGDGKTPAEHAARMAEC
eukprot:scaffold7720_cov129-Isochrysis_galbana.AAC.10